MDPRLSLLFDKNGYIAGIQMNVSQVHSLISNTYGNSVAYDTNCILYPSIEFLIPPAVNQGTEESEQYISLRPRPSLHAEHPRGTRGLHAHGLLCQSRWKKSL
jgi:hypothetical protein